MYVKRTFNPTDKISGNLYWILFDRLFDQCDLTELVGHDYVM